MELDKTDLAEKNEKKLENRIALTITVFAAVLAINGLFGGKYGDDEMIAHQKHAQMYSWYQSKGIKKMFKEFQNEMLVIERKVDSSNIQKNNYIDEVIAKNKNKITVYGNEMNEIMLGSAAVGEKNWTQEQDGKLGTVIGAEEYEAEANTLGLAGDFFDYGDLALNLALVMGAVSLILSVERQKLIYLGITIVLGVAGSLLTFYALTIAMV